MNSRNFQEAVALANRQLELIILPTERCNFRCTYCYEDFSVGKMTVLVREAVKKFIANRIELGLDVLKLSWFGGEPLLARDVIFDICGVSYGYLSSGLLKNLVGNITTNAFLLDRETLARLVELRQCNFQISLDGYGDVHDKTRRYASGAGTFDVIWKNLISAKETNYNFHIMLRIHLTDSNFDSMEFLANEISHHFCNDDRFSVYVRRIANLGGENGKTIVPLSNLKSASVSRRIKAILTRSGIRCMTEEGGVGDDENGGAVSMGYENERLGVGGDVCYASKPNSFMIRPDGRLGKCTVVFNDPRNTVGKINKDGSIFIDHEKISYWLRGNFSGDVSTLSCPAKGE